MENNTLGQCIAELRKAEGLSQAELAEEIGVSVHAINSYESGRRKPCCGAMVALEQHFGVSGAYLRGEDPELDEDDLPTVSESNQFPQILKALRKARGLTQDELAQELGISLQSVINYENGRREPNARAIVALEQYFGVTAAALLGLEEAAPADPRADELDKPLPLSNTETRLLKDFRCLSAENQTTLLRLAAKFAAIDKALNAWLDADDLC